MKAGAVNACQPLIVSAWFAPVVKFAFFHSHFEPTMARINLFGGAKAENRLRPVWQSQTADHVIGVAWAPDGTRLAAAAVSGSGG